MWPKGFGVILPVRVSVLLICAAGLFAQGTDSGSIHGVATDPSGSAVPGSRVATTTLNPLITSYTQEGVDSRRGAAAAHHLLTMVRALFFFALLATSVDHPGWRVIGPGGGGAQFNPAVSPHDPNRVLVSCDMTGAYLTEDGGASWRMFNFGSTVRFFAFDQVKPQVVYAQTTRLWRSDDGGRAWKPIYPADARVVIDGDHGDERAESSFPAVDAIAAAGNVAWAGMGNTLRRSEDGGRTWTQVETLPGRARRVYLNGGTTYVLGRGLCRSARCGRVAGIPAR